MGLQFTVEDAPDLTLPEDTIFRAQLKEMKVHEFKWTDFNDPGSPGVGVPKVGQTLQWWWEVKSDNEYNGRKVKGECDPKISNHPRNRFRQWAEALLGRELPQGMTVDIDDLVGLVADITIKHRPDKKDPSKKYEEVNDVITVSSSSTSGGGGWSDEPPF